MYTLNSNYKFTAPHFLGMAKKDRKIAWRVHFNQFINNPDFEINT